MRVSLRSVTLLYTVGLAFGVSVAVGVSMYVISSESLRRAYERRFAATAREAAYQLVDPVYRLDAFAVQRLRDLLADSQPTLTRSLVLDAEGRPFGGWIEWRREEVADDLDEVDRRGSWVVQTTGRAWRFVGPVMDASEQIHGVAAFEFSTQELHRDLNQTASAALATALTVTLLGCLIGFSLARRMTRPFSRLVESVRAIGEQRFRTPVQVSSLVELGDLAEALDRMASQLERTTVSLEEAEAARQDAERANHLKSRFLANLSHEVRTPLHAIVGHSDLLRADGLIAGQAERVGGIRTAADALLRLIEDILDLSKIESGNLEMAREAFDLVKLVHEVVEITHLRANPGTLDLFGLVSPEIVPLRWGDPDRLKQVLINLVSNALKFTRRGEVVLEVSAPSPDRVRFVVHDTGRGIPASELEAVFQPFARLIESAAVPGSGLGLAICRQLSRAMGAELRLDSVVGEGTQAIFEVSLEPVGGVARVGGSPRSARGFGFSPRVEEHLHAWFGAELASSAVAGGDGEIAIVYLAGCDDPRAVAEAVQVFETVVVFSPPGQELPGVTQARNLRLPVTTSAIEQAMDVARPSRVEAASTEVFPGLEILIVEDNAVNRLVLVAMLEALGCVVQVAADGQEGVEVWRECSPAIILMDCSMPVLDGFDATRQIRSEEEGQAEGHVPILALTAHTLREDRRRCQEAGMDGFLSKPLALEELRQALKDVLAGRQVGVSKSLETEVAV